MSRDPLLFLEDIVEACDTIRAYLDGVEYESLLGDPMRLDAVVRNLAIVGEAAGRLSGDVREAIPDVPWSQVIAMRNTLIHGYFGIDPEVVWSVCSERVGPLAQSVRRYLHERKG